VGLSNFTNMLPRRKSDGSPVRSPLESAFLTLAMPLGLDMVIGSVKRKYAILPEDDPALVCVKEVFQLKGPDRLKRLMDYYT
jgi:5-methyltetrahydrofolate--homocysteine methyltransferase